MTATTPDRLLAKMLRDRNPVSWLVAADILEEQGRDAEAAALRARADLTLKVASIVRDVNATAGKIKSRYVGIGGRLNLCVGGGERQLCLFVIRDDNGRRVSVIVQPPRQSLRREDHLFRKAAQIVDSLKQGDA